MPDHRWLATVPTRQQRLFVPSQHRVIRQLPGHFITMLCVDHGNGQVQASLKSDRGSGAQTPPRASPIAARDRGLPDSDRITPDCFNMPRPIPTCSAGFAVCAPTAIASVSAFPIPGTAHRPRRHSCRWHSRPRGQADHRHRGSRVRAPRDNCRRIRAEQSADS